MASESAEVSHATDQSTTTTTTISPTTTVGVAVARGRAIEFSPHDDQSRAIFVTAPTETVPASMANAKGKSMKDLMDVSMDDLDDNADNDDRVGGACSPVSLFYIYLLI